MNSWQHAVSFAARAHREQLRKDGRTPYVAHPMRVALVVVLVFGCTDETLVTAAVLHDVLEDTTRDFDDLEAAFGREVAEIVAALSKDPRLPEPEREMRYDEQLARAPRGARLIKLADAYDNLTDVIDEPAARRRLLDRARRAAALAEADPDLAEARRLVLELAGKVTE